MRVSGLAGEDPNLTVGSWRHGRIGTRTVNRIEECSLGFSIELLNCKKFPKLRSKWISQHCGLINDQHTSEEESQEAPQSFLGDYHNVKMELILLALPTMAGQVIEPLAQLIETLPEDHCYQNLMKVFSFVGSLFVPVSHIL